MNINDQKYKINADKKASVDATLFHTLLLDNYHSSITVRINFNYLKCCVTHFNLCFQSLRCS